jgi:hypothetical protein
MLTHKELKARALARVEVKVEYDRLTKEFPVLDESLKTRAATAAHRPESGKRIASDDEGRESIREKG